MIRVLQMTIHSHPSRLWQDTNYLLIHFHNLFALLIWLTLFFASLIFALFYWVMEWEISRTEISPLPRKSLWFHNVIILRDRILWTVPCQCTPSKSKIFLGEKIAWRNMTKQRLFGTVIKSHCPPPPYPHSPSQTKPDMRIIFKGDELTMKQWISSSQFQTVQLQ